jgi:hypothetical protein
VSDDRDDATGSGATEHYDAWEAAYRARGDELQGVLARAVQAALTAEDLETSRTILRQQRDTFPRKFCLLLYGSGPDEALGAQIRAAMQDPPSDEEWQDAVRAAGRPGRNSSIMTLLMVLLDMDGIHTVMLERQTESVPDGPLRIRAPDEFWFASFALIAELAHVIIVLSNIGPNLILETRYLDDAGLGGRVLLYAGSDLYEFDRAKAARPPTVWPLSSEGLRDAVTHLAKTPALAPKAPLTTSVFGAPPSTPI